MSQAGAFTPSSTLRMTRPAFSAITAAGTVKSAPIRKGQSCPRPENRPPATMGPKMRATELEAMLSPSMAPCRSGGEARLIMAEILGMARDMPQAPRP